VLDSYKEQLVGDAIVHTHLTALYGESGTAATHDRVKR
jgi:hypothetical protein